MDKEDPKHVANLVFVNKFVLALLLPLDIPTSRNGRPTIRLVEAASSDILVIRLFLQLYIILRLLLLKRHFLDGATLPIQQPLRQRPPILVLLPPLAASAVIRLFVPNMIFAVLLGRMTLPSVQRLQIVFLRSVLFRVIVPFDLPLIPQTRTPVAASLPINARSNDVPVRALGNIPKPKSQILPSPSTHVHGVRALRTQHLPETGRLMSQSVPLLVFAAIALRVAFPAITIRLVQPPTLPLVQSAHPLLLRGPLALELPPMIDILVPRSAPLTAADLHRIAIARLPHLIVIARGAAPTAHLLTSPTLAIIQALRRRLDNIIRLLAFAARSLVIILLVSHIPALLVPQTLVLVAIPKAVLESPPPLQAKPSLPYESSILFLPQTATVLSRLPLAVETFAARFVPIASARIPLERIHFPGVATLPIQQAFVISVVDPVHLPLLAATARISPAYLSLEQTLQIVLESPILSDLLAPASLLHLTPLAPIPTHVPTGLVAGSLETNLRQLSPFAS